GRNSQSWEPPLTFSALPRKLLTHFKARLAGGLSPAPAAAETRLGHGAGIQGGFDLAGGQPFELGGNLADALPRGLPVPPDFRGAVVADLRGQRGGQDRIPLDQLLHMLAVGARAGEGFLRQGAGGFAEQGDRVEQVARD